MPWHRDSSGAATQRPKSNRQVVGDPGMVSRRAKQSHAHDRPARVPSPVALRPHERVGQVGAIRG
eukprot:8588501-Alexandrium_andersonii.AAC.1